MKKRIILPVLTSIALLSGCSFLPQGYTSRTLDYDFSEMEFIQLEEPEEGRLAAVIKTSMGDMTAVLYPEYAPKTVDNFVNRANDGYYDNTKVYVIFQHSYAATGSSKDDGSSGATNDGQLIENEYTPKLWPFKGALLSLSSSIGYGDSRYMILNTVEFDETADANMKEPKNRDGEQLFPDELIEAWKENGAVPGMSGFFTVFGQVVGGMDVLEAIMDVPVVDEETYVPAEDIIIYSVEITQYSKDMKD